MAQLVRISSGAPWEPVAAYSRAVKAGEFVAVSGTTAIDERGLVVGAGQMYVQARQALLNIRTALQRVGLSMQDVVRTRMFVTDISRFAEVARAHHEFFAETPPASTMVEVKRLVHPAMLIEIEADAYRPSAPVPKAAEKSKPKVNAKKTSASKLKRRR
jgi:reactive intermediate/imine deaminase